MPLAAPHRHFDDIADSLADIPAKSAGSGGLSRPLLAEVLSRIAVRTPPVATRAEIASGAMLRAALPLSEGSVSKAVTSLLRHEFLVEGPDKARARPRAGRPGTSVRLAGHRWFAIGVHVSQDGGDRPVAVAAVAVPIDDHTVLATETREVVATDDLAWPMVALVDATVEVVHALVARKEVEQRVSEGWLPLLGVCVETGLRVHDGAVLVPTGDSLHGYDLRRALSSALGVPVVVEHDVSVLAVRETYGQRVRPDFALVLVADTGVRAAVAIDGRVHRGIQGMAGAIGSLDAPAAAGPAGHPRHPGTVDLRASPAGVRRALDVDTLDTADLTGRHAQEVVGEAGRSLGAGIAALVRVVDPGQVRIIVPSALRSGPGRRYVDEVRAVLAATYAGRGRPDAVNLDVDPDDAHPQRCARAAAIRVVVEFIDHLSGIDGCPPRERSLTAWLASGRAAAAGGGLGLLIAPVVPFVPVVPFAAVAYAAGRYAASRRRTVLGRRVRLPSRREAP